MGVGGATLELGEGLGIGNFGIRNRALLAKWLWCFYLESDSLWHRIIVSKHGPHPFEWTTLGVNSTFRNPWKDISFELPSFSQFSCCFVGDGKDNYFWEDQWVGENSLW